MQRCISLDVIHFAYDEPIDWSAKYNLFTAHK